MLGLMLLTLYLESEEFGTVLLCHIQSFLKKLKNQIHSTKYKLIQAKGLGVMFESIIVHLDKRK